MAYDSQAGMTGAMSGAATGAMVGSVVAPGIGTAIGAGVGLVAGAATGFMTKKGPDYSNVTNQFKARNAQIASFAASLGAARAKYMTSLNNMYNDAYTRFSGNAEAGFAGRGMAVNGGAFASALARESGRMSFEGANLAAGMEREDLRSVDNAYAGNGSGYMSSISGGPALQYNADREDMRSIGGFAGKLAMMKAGASNTEGNNDNFGKDGSYWAQNSNGGYDKLGLGPSWRS